MGVQDTTEKSIIVICSMKTNTTQLTIYCNVYEKTMNIKVLKKSAACNKCVNRKQIGQVVLEKSRKCEQSTTTRTTPLMTTDIGHILI